jgi:exopolysaccharide biosynthesis polyprenyl glycosylphosphotransferase
MKQVQRFILSRPFSPPIAQLAADVSVVVAGWLSVLLLSNITEQFKRPDGASLLMVAVASAVTLAIMKRRGLYAGRPALPRTGEISAVFVAALAGSSAVAVLAAFLDWHIGAWELLLGWLVVFSGRTLARGLLRAVVAEIPSIGRAEKVVIVGTGDEAKELADLILDHPESRLALAGVVGNLAVAERSGLIERWIGPAGRLVELMHQHGATGAIVTATGFRGEQFRAITRELFDSGYDVHLTTGVSRMGQGRFDVRSLSHEPLVVMARNRTRSTHLVLKRILDLTLATLALVLFLPVMVLVAAAIWLQDRGPVTYTSQRAGRRGELFPMFKFRSMVTNAEALKAEMQQDNERTGPLFKVSNDPRITRVGRFIRETSLDELPQLFNVIRGDMSLVGPRPALPEEQALFDDELKDRFVVRPGITGLWQVEARSNSSFNAYRRLDLHYVENWSLGLDLRILLATAEQVVVSVALMPLRLLRRSSATDAITARPAEIPSGPVPVRGWGSDTLEDVVIDLRQRSLARQAVAVEAPPMADSAPSVTRRRDR